MKPAEFGEEKIGAQNLRRKSRVGVNDGILSQQFINE